MKKLSMFLAVLTISTGVMAQSKSGKNVTSIIGGTYKAKSLTGEHGGGSTVGGGTIYSSIISWCDSSLVILESARSEAIELNGFDGDRIGAIRILYNGLLAALENVGNDVNFNSSITYKAITRGINIAQRMGVPEIISDSPTVFVSDKDQAQIVDFMNYYYGFISETAEKLDKKFYVPYVTNTICTNCAHVDTTVGTLELEKEFINYSTAQIKHFRRQFVRNRTNGEGVYPTIEVDIYLKALSYLVQETSRDLDESLFARAYECQSRQLTDLANKIQYFLNTRTDSRKDPVKMNDFTLRTDKLIGKILAKQCL